MKKGEKKMKVKTVLEIYDAFVSKQADDGEWMGIDARNELDLLASEDDRFIRAFSKFVDISSGLPKSEVYCKYIEEYLAEYAGYKGTEGKLDELEVEKDKKQFIKLFYRLLFLDALTLDNALIGSDLTEIEMLLDRDRVEIILNHKDFYSIATLRKAVLLCNCTEEQERLVWKTKAEFIDESKRGEANLS